MGVLNDREILAAIHSGELAISPFHPTNVQPASIDLTLHPTLETVTLTQLDVADISSQQLQNSLRVHDITDDGYALLPGQFVTGYSAEEVRIPSFMSGKVFNRTNLARWGIDATTAACINPGFRGRMVLVIRNFAPYPIVLRAGMRICQLQLTKLESIAMPSYDERNDAERILAYVKEAIGRLPPSVVSSDLDTSLSDFLHERIAHVCEARHVS